MFTHRLTAIAATTIAAAAVGLGATATAGASSIVSTDEAFLTQIRNAGISFSSPQEAVRNGHQVCAALASGRSGADVAAQILHETNLTPRLAALFVIDAAQAYCPQLSDQLR